MLRGSKYKTDLELSVVPRDIDNFTQIKDLVTKSTTGSRHLTIGKANLSNTFYINQVLFMINPSINKGLSWFNALSDNLSSATQKDQFQSD
jgi:hypothetical protein